MNSTPVIAVFDIGKTNKKLLLFDEQYQIVFEHAERLQEIADEDGFPCEDLASLTKFVLHSLQDVLNDKSFFVKAVNFSAYGASLIYIDEHGKPLTPLYNYLKPYSQELKDEFYKLYGGEVTFSLLTASPVLDSLNSGMQLFRLKHERPELFKKVRFALHLPQYLSFLISGKAYSDITSIGCHTNLWNFTIDNYHSWVKSENIIDNLPPIVASDKVELAEVDEKKFVVGVGLHDSSAALIPYLASFTEPFVLISSGTWCISLNPFNQTSLTAEELRQDCLCYLSYQGNPVKASRLFAGQEHEDGIKKIAAYFGENANSYWYITYDPAIVTSFNNEMPVLDFDQKDLFEFNSSREAYHFLVATIVKKQIQSTQLVLNGSPVKNLFVDGGFGQNEIYMNLLAASFPDLNVGAASVAQATALGAALAIHNSWNQKPIPKRLVQVKHFPAYAAIAQ